MLPACLSSSRQSCATSHNELLSRRGAAPRVNFFSITGIALRRSLRSAKV